MKRLILLTALVWVPFLSIFVFASPALTGRVGDTYPHMVFHVLSPSLLVGAFVVVRRSLAQTTARGQRVLLWVLSFTIPVAVVGNVLELAAAVRRFAADGWVSRATPDLFESGAGVHTLGANLTIPGLMASMLVVLMLVVAAWRTERSSAAPAYTARTHRGESGHEEVSGDGDGRDHGHGESRRPAGDRR